MGRRFIAMPRQNNEVINTATHARLSYGGPGGCPGEATGARQNPAQGSRSSSI